ncbi:hypothetical protein [Shimia sediminis]|uniref:hypothetical protein n=1 Tax=Shimia sediminis TaxID=2497945 RepID=UPI000F8F7411|nr:hypothetical protein [Shimia sediminis]
MKFAKKSLHGAALVALIATSSSVIAQGDGMGLSDAQTSQVTEIMGPGLDACSKVDVVYRPDCFQQVYRNASRQLGSNAGYWEAEVALTRVGRNLYNFVRSNTDRNGDKIKAGGFRLKPVTAESLPEAGQIYQDNVAKAEQILRGGSSAEQRYFKPIADLVSKYATAIPR